MAIRIGGTDVVDDNRKGIFQSANVGTFANPERPGSASTGDVIWSTTDNQLQVWNGSSWEAAVGSGQVISASGGTEFTVDGYKVHAFSSTGTFTLNSPSAVLEYFIVAGGGGGGVLAASNPVRFSRASSGGAGGIVLGRSTFSAGTYTISVGGGGAGVPSPAPGTPSYITHPGGTITAIGGGAGGGRSPTGPFNGDPGGSGGGAGAWAQPPTAGSAGAGTPGQGTPGGSLIPAPTGWRAGTGGGWGFPGNPAQAAYSPSGSFYLGQGYQSRWSFPPSFGQAHGFVFTRYEGPFNGTSTRDPKSSWFGFGGGQASQWFNAPYLGTNIDTPTCGNGGPVSPAGASGYGGMIAIRYFPVQ